MRPFPRKVGDPIPVALLIQPDGTLVLADGGDVKTYLAEAHAVNVGLGHATAGEPYEAVIVPRKFQERLEQAAWMHFNHSA
jgi:hypothetical protein